MATWRSQEQCYICHVVVTDVREVQRPAPAAAARSRSDMGCCSLPLGRGCRYQPKVNPMQLSEEESGATGGGACGGGGMGVDIPGVEGTGKGGG